MKHLLVLSALFLIYVSARADFDVVISADGTTIEAPVFGKLNFVNQIAEYKKYSADSGGVFFAIGEEFIETLKKDGFAVYSTTKGHTSPTFGQVYFVMALDKQDGKLALVFPVMFSPFGMCLHQDENEVYHAGTVMFNNNSVISMLTEKNKQ